MPLECEHNPEPESPTGSKWRVLDQCQITSTNLMGYEEVGHVMNIWWLKPHVINKRCCGSIILESDSSATVDHHAVALCQDECYNFSTRKVLPKSAVFSPAFEYMHIYKDAESGIVAEFGPICPNDQGGTNDSKCASVNVTYRLVISTDGHVQFELPVELESSSDSDWLIQNWWPKIQEWLTQQCNIQTASSGGQQPMKMTLQLVDLEAFHQRYQLLKKKYAKNIIDNWCERTDPKKFVYEDLSIAAYLLTLWEADDMRKKCGRFADIGCGNGLLVYILCKEGYRGIGMDIRSRGIWSFLKPQIYSLGGDLIVYSFEPWKWPEWAEGVDWFIGNHSDELTPWIPVLAARNGGAYFVLPCCPHDFYGKYQRRSSKVSSYQCYLGYVAQVGQLMGFDVQEDKLRIPSTKRTCYVGLYRRDLPPKDDESIRSLIGQLGQTPKSILPEFEARPAVEVVRNCTRLAPGVADGIVKKIADHLLAQEQSISAVQEDCQKSARRWNSGGTLTFPQVALLLSDEEKRSLRSQCGGLQTLLRNHQHIFKLNGISVTLRDYASEPKDAKKKAVNKRRCWFNDFHPNGCPISDPNLCDFDHSPPSLNL